VTSVVQHPAGASTPTVGDTIWVARTVAVPSGATLRPGDWDPADPVERLGPARVALRGDSADVAYPIVVWRAGTLALDVPGPLLLGAGGRIDSLPPIHVSLDLASVLPAVPADSTLAPQPRADFVPRTSASLAPFLIFLAIAAVLLAPLHWWWRRRGPARQRPPLVAGGGYQPPLHRWAEAGESHAVAAVAAARLRSLIAQRMPAAHAGLDTEDLLRAVAARRDWPLGELGDLLRSLDTARFGERAALDAVSLSRRADELAPRLVPEAA
jgi:hypothetical protein